MILPKQQITSLSEISTDQISSLASLMRTLGIKMDNLFATSFPYSMGIHQAPTDGKSYPGLQMHIHYYPPLLRSATVRKFMVGYELMAMPQRDLSAETSAQRLRDQSNVHYLERM
jgi:UDPglucose--hexose-1-phosphate uridylyltransferase